MTPDEIAALVKLADEGIGRGLSLQEGQRLADGVRDFIAERERLRDALRGLVEAAAVVKLGAMTCADEDRNRTLRDAISGARVALGLEVLGG